MNKFGVENNTWKKRKAPLFFFIRSFNQYVLNSSSVPDTVLSLGRKYMTET